MQLRMVAIAAIAAGMILTFVTSVSAASWSPAVRIATSDAEITPQVKLLADGRTALGLRRAYLGFGVSIARPRAPFSAPTWIRLTPDRTGSARLPFLHRTALARDGTAVVLFAAHLRVTRERRIVFRPGQAQAAPRSISSDGHSVGAWDSSADLAIASDGTGVAAWARYTGSRWQVEVATMDHHGDFAAPVAIDAPDPFVSDITVAAAPGHNALVVWRSLPSDSDDAFFFEGHLDGVAVTDGVVGERLNISGRQP